VMRFRCLICRVEVEAVHYEDRGDKYYVICPRGHEQFVRKGGVTDA
jgi:hypothetical protein